MYIPYNLAIILLEIIYLEKHVHGDVCTKIFVSMLFAMV